MPWLLLAKSQEEYLDADCLPDGLVVADPSKFPRKEVDKLWDHWSARSRKGLPILRFLKAKVDDLPFGLPREEPRPLRKKRQYVEVSDEHSDEDEVEPAEKGKGKVTQLVASSSKRQLSPPPSKRPRLSGDVVGVPEANSPAASADQREDFLHGLSDYSEYADLLRFLWQNLPRTVSRFYFLWTSTALLFG